MPSKELLQIPRVMIAGTHSGVGKTTIATGIMAALAGLGLPVQGYKVGPDYIDPSYHTLATGRSSRNLDLWLLGESLLSTFARSAQGCWAVIEGVMGLFDGIAGTQGYGSSADIAKMLEAPVVLVVDAKNMSRSIAALVHGYATFDPDLKVCGVILNRVKSSSQEALLRHAMKEINMPILGVLSTEERIRLPERHLGLVPSQEKAYHDDYFVELTRVISQSIDLAKLQEIMLAVGAQGEAGAETAPVANRERLATGSVGEGNGEKSQEHIINQEIYKEEFNKREFGKEEIEKITIEKNITEEELSRRAIIIPRNQYKVNILSGEKISIRLGIAWDEAFTFYYQDALDCAESLGFKLVQFSPLHDTELPRDLHALIIGGGFPELHLERLNQNQRFMEALRNFASTGKTIYAECGGYMYLGQEITDFAGRAYSMAGLIPIKSEMTKKLQGMGYRRGVFTADSFLGKAGMEVHGHEFHYSKVDFQGSGDGEPASAYNLYKGEQLLRSDGYAKKNIFASYLHLNFAGHPQLMERWAEYIRQGA